MTGRFLGLIIFPGPSRFTRSGAAGGRGAVKLLGLDDALRVEILDERGASSAPARSRLAPAATTRPTAVRLSMAALSCPGRQDGMAFGDLSCDP